MTQLPQPPSHVNQPDSAAIPAWRGAPPGRLPGRSPGSQRVALWVGGAAFAMLLVCCGGLTVIGALAGDPQPDGGAKTADRPAAAVGSTPTGTSTEAPSLEVATPAAPTTKAPVAETRTITSTKPIPYGTRTVKDSTLAKGTRKVRTKGIRGVKTLTYEVTYTDGAETDRRLVREEVTRSPVTEVVAVGTKASAPRCDPNYSGCVPVASDVDCAGGSGNGPAYVNGVVKVIGDDIYDLDRDGDGYGCDTD